MGHKGKSIAVDAKKSVPAKQQQSTNSKICTSKLTPEGINAPNEGNTTDHQKARKSKNKPGVVLEGLKARLGEIQENISNIANTSLYGTLIGDPVDVKEIRRIIRYHWKFMKDGFQLIPMANNWFEIRFDDSEDKIKVWNGRPFHISHQLLLLKEWRVDFDPITEPLSKVDVWIRFPGLLTQFVSNQVLTFLVEENKLGTVLRVDVFNIYGACKRYPRVCVSMDLAKVPKKHIFVLNEKEELLFFLIWFEDFSEGCGACGNPSYTFDDCLKRMVLLKQGAAPSVVTKAVEMCPEKESGSHEDKSEWVKIASKRPKDEVPLLIGHSKSEIFKCFDMNVEPSSESSSKSSEKMAISASPGMGSTAEAEADPPCSLSWPFHTPLLNSLHPQMMFQRVRWVSWTCRIALSCLIMMRN